VDPVAAARVRRLQLLGVLSGVTAGAWLGAAEAPTKMVSLGISPVAVSLVMVLGVFLARWSLPALLRGTSAVGADVRQAPHLVAWAVLAGCLWSVANTLTIFAIKDIGLSIAFPLWNSNSLLGIVWCVVFFNELRAAGWPDGAIVHENTIDAYIARLRRKLEEIASSETIETMRGVGYVLR